MAVGGPPIRVAGVILHRDGRILLQHRDNDPAIIFPGAWAIFGGHVEPGEDPADAAIREIAEELGLHLHPPLPLFHHGTEGARERFIFLAPLTRAPADLTLNEGQGMALLGAREIESYPVVPAHREILRGYFALAPHDTEGSVS